MRDLFKRDYRDRSFGAILTRLLAHIRLRRPLFERRQGGNVCVRTDDDGIKYINPTPNGAIPMAKRRMLNVRGG